MVLSLPCLGTRPGYTLWFGLVRTVHPGLVGSRPIIDTVYFIVVYNADFWLYVDIKCISVVVYIADFCFADSLELSRHSWRRVFINC